MPISQDRMIELIKAAQDFRTACYRMEEEIKFHFEELEHTDTSPAKEALTTLYLRCRVNLKLSAPASSTAVIEVEARHFKTTASRNRAAMRRQGRLRAKAKGTEVPEVYAVIKRGKKPSRPGLPALPKRVERVDDPRNDPDYNWGQGEISAEGVQPESQAPRAESSPAEPAQSDLDLMNQFADERAEQMKIIKPEQS